MIDETPPQLLRPRQTQDGSIVEPIMPTSLVARVSVDFTTVVLGTAHVQVFSTHDAGWAGGVVIRLNVDDRGGVQKPHALCHRDGRIELHLSGESEARAMLTALRAALAAIKEARL